MYYDPSTHTPEKLTIEVLVKTAFSTILISLFFVLAGCGGGSSSSDGGGEPPPEATVPQTISGSYSGTWEGSGTNASGVFTCEGEFNLNISQSGSTIAVAFSVISSSGSGTGQCTEAFSFTGNGIYNAGNGDLAILSIAADITAALNGGASEQGGKITINGTWSTTDTNSADVIASGTWTAESL